MDCPPGSLIAAIGANLADQARAFASRSPQIQPRDERDALRTESEIAHPYLNRVFLARFPASVVDQRIQEVLANYRSRKVPVGWMVGPSSKPPDLGSRLLRAGLIRGREEAGMAMDLATLPEQVAMPKGLVVDRVADRESLEDWVQVVTASFGLPDSLGSVLCEVLVSAAGSEVSPWRLFVGVLDGEPVGASRLFLHSDAAGVYHVGASPRARGRGVGSAMTFAALLEARRWGSRLAVLRATRSTQGLHGRLGFREYCRFGWYLWPGEGAS